MSAIWSISAVDADRQVLGDAQHRVDLGLFGGQGLALSA